MNYYVSNLEVSPYIQHFGVLGMHWGVRRYQNADGSLTAAGKKRYDSGDGSNSKKSYNAALASKSVELKKKSDAAYKKAAEKEATAYKNWKKKHPNEDDDNFGDWLTTKSGSKVDYGRAESNTAYKLCRDAAALGENYVKNEVKSYAVAGTVLGAFVGTVGGIKSEVIGAAVGGVTMAALGYQNASTIRAKTAAKYGYKRN